MAECGFFEYFDPKALSPNFGLTSEFERGQKIDRIWPIIFLAILPMAALFLIALEMADFVQSKNIWAFLAVLFLIALQDLLFLIALRGVVNIFDCTKVNFIFFDCTKLNFDFFDCTHSKSVCFDCTPQNGIFLKTCSHVSMCAPNAFGRSWHHGDDV